MGHADGGDDAFVALVARVRALEDAITKLQTDKTCHSQVEPSPATSAQIIAATGAISRPAAGQSAVAEAPPWPPVLAPVETHSALHWDVVRYVGQNDAQVQTQQAAREAVVQALAHRLRASWPYAQLVCYGSMRTGLSTPTSDIDCAVLNPPPVASMQHAVYFLRSIFEQESWVVGTTALAHAALPILKLQVAPESRRPDLVFQVDVSLSSGPVHYGLIATHVFSGEIGARPPVRALTIVVKDYLASLGLNQTYTGGLCSHAIFLLARAYVVAADGGTDGRAHAADLGQMLPGFFHFYGHHFDPARVTVKWVPAKLVPRLERKPHTLPPRVTRSRGARIPRSSPLAPKEKPTRTPHASRLHVHHKCLTPLGSAGGAPTPSPSGHPSPRPRGTRHRRFPSRD